MNERGVGIIKNIRESTLVQVAETAYGPVHSVAARGAYHLTRNRRSPLYAHVFDEQKEHPEKAVQLTDAWQTLNRAFIHLGNRSEHGGLKSIYNQWNSVRNLLQEAIGKDNVITDYVTSIDGNEFNVYVKVKQPENSPSPYKLASLSITKEPLTPESIQQQISGENITVELHCSSNWATTTDRVLPETDVLIEMENGIAAINDTYKGDYRARTTHRLSRSANTHQLRRHEDFDRDGKNISDIRYRRVYTIGEIQELQRYMFSEGLSFDPLSGEVKIHEQLAKRWIQMRALAGVVAEDAHKEMYKYARECMYFKMINQRISECPQEVNMFMNSPVFKAYEAKFKDGYLAARGQTEFDIAKAMLGNYFLMHFEGSTDMMNSPSQKHMAKEKGYQFLIDSYVASRPDLHALIPTVRDPAVDQPEALKKIKVTPQQTPISHRKLNDVVAKADEALEKIPYEIRRQKTGAHVLERMRKLVPIIVNDDKLARFFPIVVAKLGMAAVPGEGRYTASSWLNKAGEMMPEGTELHPFESLSEGKKVEDSIRHIFNGELQKKNTGASNSAYESQVARIYENGGNILKFLMDDKRVPENVKDFIGTITSHSIADRVLEQFGPIADQDPNVANRFYDDFAEFQTSVVHRYVTDFVRGVETHLINLTQPVGDRVARRTLGDWKNYDFSQIPDDILRLAITYTLADGEHRIKKLNHETKENITLKDKQELIERWIGTFTYDLQFVQHDQFMNIWRSLGGAWDCICFSRKTVFNPRTLKQY